MHSILVTSRTHAKCARVKFSLLASNHVTYKIARDSSRASMILSPAQRMQYIRMYVRTYITIIAQAAQIRIHKSICGAYVL